MMYLLDTNALLFFLYDSGKLSKRASDIIYHNDEKISVSMDEIRRLPAIHGDPFDRLIISQAISENLVIITKDGTIPMYNVKVLW